MQEPLNQVAQEGERGAEVVAPKVEAGVGEKDKTPTAASWYIGRSTRKSAVGSSRHPQGWTALGELCDAEGQGVHSRMPQSKSSFDGFAVFEEELFEFGIVAAEAGRSEVRVLQNADPKFVGQ